MAIIKNKSVREQVYEALKKLIIEGEIKQGEKIVETEYAKLFQISRTPVREAIRMLELEGFVEMKSTGGVIVKVITKDDIEEIYRIRIALESIIIEEAINKLNAKHIKLLDSLMGRTEKIILEENKSEKIFKLFSEFNNILFDIASQKRVTEMIKNIILYLKKFRRLAVESSGRRKAAFDDHLELVEAIKAKNLEKALILNRNHLEKSRDFIKKVL